MRSDRPVAKGESVSGFLTPLPILPCECALFDGDDHCFKSRARRDGNEKAVRCSDEDRGGLLRVVDDDDDPFDDFDFCTGMRTDSPPRFR
mmetsp:Transcript_51482/g.95280  ORF Transcript_51482/g.95280 Transcript_51482/m.95280 type:complete len:90 (-) Transcript_51482:97-366(-)